MGHTDFIDMGDGFGQVEAWDGTSSLIPDGEYLWVIEKGEIKQGENGAQIVFTNVVVDGPHKGFSTRTYYNHSSDIGRKLLRGLLNAVGATVSDRGFNMSDVEGKRFVADASRRTYVKKQPDADGNPVKGTSIELKGMRPEGAASAPTTRPGVVNGKPGSAVPTRGRTNGLA